MRMPLTLTFTILLAASNLLAGPYAPAAGQPGSTAIANNSLLIVEWAG